MKHETTAGANRTDPGGPLLALCVGKRCTALRKFAGTAESVDGLRNAVRDSAGAVFIASERLGPCSLAAVAAVARHYSRGDTEPNVWLTGTEEPWVW